MKYLYMLIKLNSLKTSRNTGVDYRLLSVEVVALSVNMPLAQFTLYIPLKFSFIEDLL